MYDAAATLLTIFGTVVIILACLCLNCCSEWYTCDSKATEQGLEHQWGPFKGCLIKVDDRWIDYDKWRIME